MSAGLAVVLVENAYECLEFHYSRLRLEEAGYEVKAVAPKKDVVYKSEQGYWAKSDAAFEDIDASSVRVLICPGGLGCPDQLRRHAACKKLVADAHAAGAVVGYICHGAWIAISAKIVRGTRGTCHPAIRDDLENAGVEFVDAPSVVDGRLVSAQKPPDLAKFMVDVLRVATEQRAKAT